MATFTWKPDLGADMSCEPRVETAKFGDGYEQRVGAGINNQMRTWSVKFTNAPAEVLEFLEACGGSTSFVWTDPLGRTGNYVCRKWKAGHVGADVYAISGEFQQVQD